MNNECNIIYTTLSTICHNIYQPHIQTHPLLVHIDPRSRSPNHIYVIYSFISIISLSVKLVNSSTRPNVCKTAGGLMCPTHHLLRTLDVTDSSGLAQVRWQATQHATSRLPHPAGLGRPDGGTCSRPYNPTAPPH